MAVIKKKKVIVFSESELLCNLSSNCEQKTIQAPIKNFKLNFTIDLCNDKDVTQFNAH